MSLHDAVMALRVHSISGYEWKCSECHYHWKHFECQTSSCCAFGTLPTTDEEVDSAGDYCDHTMLLDLDAVLALLEDVPS